MKLKLLATAFDGRDDVKYAVRRVLKQPVASAVSVATLACAIGAGAATWSLMSATLLNPLHLSEPEQLVQIGVQRDAVDGARTSVGFTYPAVLALREAIPMPLATWGAIGWPTPLIVRETGEAPRSVRFTSHDFLSVLRVHTSVGRFYTSDEDQPGAPLVAVLSDRFWRREFRADSSVIGRVIHVRDWPVTIVGIAPHGFRGLEVDSAPDLFMPLHTIDRIQPYRDLFGDRPPVSWVQVVGRLPDGVTLAQMQLRLNDLHIDPASHKTFVLTDIQTAAIPELSRAGVRQFGLLLGGTVAMLLAIGSLTVGMLLVLRTEARSHEIAMCRALGASNARLAAGIALEGLLLAVTGALTALPISQILFSGIRLFELPGHIRVDLLELALDRRVLMGTVGAAIVAVLFMTALVSVFGVRRTPHDVLRLQERATPRIAGRYSRSALVTAQVAVTLVLATGAGLFTRSVIRALSLNPGIDTSRLIRTELDLTAYGYDDPRAVTFFDALGSRLASESVIASVGFARSPSATSRIQIDGELRDLPSYVYSVYVDRTYLSTIGLRVFLGRDFTTDDRAAAAPVGIVSASLARVIARDGNPIGHRIGGVEVVGVVPDFVSAVTDKPPFRLYQPLARTPTEGAQAGAGDRLLIVRASDQGPAAIAALIATVHALDPQIHVRPMTTLESEFVADMAPQRFGMTVMGALGAIALLLSVFGTYVLAESMAMLRRREMGIRAALGARVSHLRRLLLSETFRLVGAGLLLGVCLAWLGAGAIRAFLFQVEPFDPVITGSIAAAIAALALLVSLRPAMTASRVDLARVLREE